MLKRTCLYVLCLLVFQSLALAKKAPKTRTETAILAGGCFWCIEADYEKLNGVLDVVSGYSGGKVKNPAYDQVSAGGSGHLEVVKITYNANIISYPEILGFFWHHVDPTRDDGQFCDRGPQYRPAIFYNGKVQHRQALASVAYTAANKPFAAPLKVELIATSKFYPAENYHQNYYRKNPFRYKFYRYKCGRDARVEALWGKTGGHD